MRRRKAQPEHPHGAPPSTATADIPAAANGEPPPPEDSAVPPRDTKDASLSPSRFCRLLSLSLGVLRLVACGVWLYALVGPKDNAWSSAVECDMTYSMREFYALALPPATDNSSRSTHHPSYGLYKFTDQRDPRQAHLRRQQRTPPLRPLEGPEWCDTHSQQSHPRAAVLYVPGHGGSYAQSRSLGAHGLQLTHRNNPRATREALAALGNGPPHPNVPSLANFTFDVYAVDFGEEGAGLHGALVERQAAFVAHAVAYLTSTCPSPQPNSLVIVAHSMGGLVARVALAQHSTLRVDALLTLATPHAHPVLAMEPSLHVIHARLATAQHATQIPIVSIGGGFRDELIPPASCRLTSTNGDPTTTTSSRLTLAAVDLMTAGVQEATHPPQFGMDHRAIVWCHNLLRPIRSILFALLQQGPDGRLLQTLDLPADYDYARSVEASHADFVTTLGRFPAVVAEVGLLYSIERLVGLFSVSCALFTLWGVSPQSSLVISGVAPVLAMQSGTPFPLSTMLLSTLVAHAVFLVLFSGMSYLCRWATSFRRCSPISFVLFVFLPAFVALQIMDTIQSGRMLTWDRMELRLTLALVPTTLLWQIYTNAVAGKESTVRVSFFWVEESLGGLKKRPVHLPFCAHIMCSLW
jgi:pimeloyl-ACP methyl ester carboxylesterase